MRRAAIIIATAVAVLAAPAHAETYEVHMLNKGEAGAMVFEPSFLRIAPGDTIRFVATDPSHNAESVPELRPDGAATFKGKINEEIEVTFDVEGLYGIKCLPHYAMGMVATVAVGAVAKIPDDYFQGRIPPRARQRFDDQLADL